MENAEYEWILEQVRESGALQWAGPLLEVFKTVHSYLNPLGISVTKTAGSRYFFECYALYALDGMEASPQMLLLVAEIHGRRSWHVRRGLLALRQKLALLDPYTAQWTGRGYRHWLRMMFQYMDERAGGSAASKKAETGPAG